MKEKVSVIILCYRSEQMIVSVVEELIGVLKGRSYEIILVCDCSPENVGDACGKAC